jgi:hypothetical protein
VSVLGSTLFYESTKPLPFSDFLNYCFTREHNFFTAAKPIVNFFVDSFIYLFIHLPVSSTVRHNFPRLRTNDCGIKTDISLTDVYENQTSSLFCLEARSRDQAASAAIYDTLYGFISGIHFNLSTKLMALKRQLWIHHESDIQI